ncbi:MAG: DUF2256 domain-containing protein [Halieaceae bacterium]
MGKALRPEKTCPVCERPFQWRARWRRNWPNVVYCSRACASRRRTLKAKQAAP